MRIAVVLAVITAMSRLAYAEDDLARARERETALDYAGGLAICDQALARGGLDPFRWVDFHLLAGKLAAGLDRPQEAEGHFARALALRPDLALPDGTSPKLTGPFSAAKARSVPLAITLTSVGGLVTLRPDADPLGLVAGISVHVVDGAGAHRDVVDRRAVRIAIPVGTTAIEASALDGTGNRIWTGAPPPSPTGAPVTTTPPRRRSLLAHWPVWAVTSGVALGYGGFAAWRFSVEQTEWNRLRAEPALHDFSELRSVEDRGRYWGWTANGAFVVGAAAGLAAIVLYARGDEVAVSASPTGVSLAGRF